MSLSKTEERVLRNVILRLQCAPVRHSDGSYRPGESEEVRAALTGDAKLFLDTWVIAPLAMLLPEQRDTELAERLSRR